MVQGEALDAQVQETKLHQERLAALAAELERLRAAHADADRSHQALLADFEPKRQRHQSLKVPTAPIQHRLGVFDLGWYLTSGCSHDH